jgi:psiF repeat
MAAPEKPRRPLGSIEESVVKISVTRAAAHGLAALLIATPMMCTTAFAADAAMTPQQRMAMCSAQNKGKKGDDYKKSQSDCLKGNDAAPAAATPMTPQQKMAACSKANKGKKGDDYKKSQSDCLKS